MAVEMRMLSPNNINGVTSGQCNRRVNLKLGHAEIQIRTKGSELGQHLRRP